MSIIIAKDLWHVIKQNALRFKAIALHVLAPLLFVLRRRLIP